MWEALQALSLQAGAFCWSLVLLLKWLHAQTIQPTGRMVADTLLPIWEESLRAFVREVFATISRSLNTFSAFVLSLLSGRSYRRTAVRNAAQKQQAWHRWWQQARGTFNALIEQEGLAPGEPDGNLSPPVTPRSPQRRLSGLGSAPLPSPALSGSSSGSCWRFWRRRGSAHEAGPGPSTGQADRQLVNGELRHGTALFELPSAFSLTQMIDSRGLLEEWRLGCEVAVGRAFSAARRFLHRLLWLDESGGGSGRHGSSRAGSPADLLERRMRRSTPPPQHLATVSEEAAAAGEAAAAATSSAAATGAGAAAADTGAAAAPRPSRKRIPLRNMLRSGRHWEEDLNVWTASDVILREGYPLEQHSVTTPDGYVLQVQRIPRHGARDVVFFQHGVLDTSLGWVSNGVVGSAAFAAYDAGFDVWLGNSRSNAPRLHLDPDRQGSRYWLYSINELGVYDIGAVVTHIHNTKMAELANPGRHSAAAQEAPAQQAGQLRRSASDSQLDALRWVDVHSGSSRGGLEPASSSGLGGEQGRQGGAAAGGHEGDAAASSSQQPAEQAGGGSKEEGQPWWQRFTSSLGGAPLQEAAIAPVAGGAQPLRRVLSAPEPLLALGQEGATQYAVPVRMRQRQRQPQQRRAGGSSKSSSGKAQGSKGSSTAAASSSAAAEGPQEVLPYRLQAVAHSLGAACVMMYAVVCRMRGQPHRLRRLVLMSPAGFHSPIPGGMALFKYLFPPLVRLVDRTPLLRGHGLGMRLPSPLLRYITFKFSKDLRHMPAMQDLVAAFMRGMTGGDTSQWHTALQMPHYSAFAMPALSLHCGAHFAQWALDPSFRLFDYGSKAANQQHYGTDKPPSLAENYRLLDIPVDVLAGGSDGVIPPAAVLHHVRHLRTAGVPCSFRILPYGHMALVMAVADDIRMYVLSKLRNPLP